MVEISLNNILNLSSVEIENSKIELKMTEGPGGIAYIDKWLSLEQPIKDGEKIEFIFRIVDYPMSSIVELCRHIMKH